MLEYKTIASKSRKRKEKRRRREKKIIRRIPPHCCQIIEVKWTHNTTPRKNRVKYYWEKKYASKVFYTIYVANLAAVNLNKLFISVVKNAASLKNSDKSEREKKTYERNRRNETEIFCRAAIIIIMIIIIHTSAVFTVRK